MTYQELATEIENAKEIIKTDNYSNSFLKHYYKMLTEMNRLNGKTWDKELWVTDSSYKQVSKKSPADAVCKLVSALKKMNGVKVDEEGGDTIVYVYTDYKIYRYKVCTQSIMVETRRYKKCLDFFDDPEDPSTWTTVADYEYPYEAFLVNTEKGKVKFWNWRRIAIE